MTTNVEYLELTAEMFGQSLRVPKDRAYQLLKFGVDMGWVRTIGNMPPPNGRGRGATIYGVPTDFGDRVQQLWHNRTGLA